MTMLDRIRHGSLCKSIFIAFSPDRAHIICLSRGGVRCNFVFEIPTPIILLKNTDRSVPNVQGFDSEKAGAYDGGMHPSAENGTKRCSFGQR